MIEIERKFLVLSEGFKDEATCHYKIVQGFLNTDKERTVRVRLKNEQAYITVKGKSSKDGLERFEWEKEISKDDALTLLDLCEKPILEKTRFEVIVGLHTFEVDVFHRENQGLIIAEVELNSKEERFDKPIWLGDEVTGDIKYYNSNLTNNPYKNWK